MRSIASGTPDAACTQQWMSESHNLAWASTHVKAVVDKKSREGRPATRSIASGTLDVACKRQNCDAIAQMLAHLRKLVGSEAGTV